MSTLFSYFEGNLEEYLTYIKEVKDNRLVKIRLAPASALKDIGVDDSFYHVLDNFAVTHILAKHANPKEVLRGQLIIEEADFLFIPDIILNFDSYETITPRDGRDLILFTKNYPDCKRVYVEEIRKGRHELAGVTYYKQKRKLTGAKS